MCIQSIVRPCSPCSLFSQPNIQIECISSWVDEVAFCALPLPLFTRPSSSPCLSLRNVVASRESHSLVPPELCVFCVLCVFRGAKCTTKLRLPCLLIGQTTHHSSTTEKSKRQREIPLCCHVCHAHRYTPRGTKMNLDALFRSHYGKKNNKRSNCTKTTLFTQARACSLDL